MTSHELPKSPEQQPKELLRQLGKVPTHEVAKRPYDILTNPYERMYYAHLTDRLITILDGTADGKPYDAVVYLDSSARPVSWMVSEMWDFAARKDEQGNPVAKPKTFFSNMDARRNGTDITEATSERLREVYSGLSDLQSNKEAPKVLVVDEIAVSGDTVDVARKRFEAAFPGISFRGYAWKDEQAVPDTRRDNVRWYERSNHRYKAVLDWQELTDKEHQKLVKRGIEPPGAFLATPNPNQFGAGILRGEITRLVNDVKTGNLPFWPSNERDIDQMEEMISKYNAGLSGRQFRDMREWMKFHYSPTPRANLITSDTTGPLTDKQAIMHSEEKGSTTQVRVPKIDAETEALIRKLGLL